MGSECNVYYNYVYYNFFLFLRLNGSENDLKPRIYYITLLLKLVALVFLQANTIAKFIH